MGAEMGSKGASVRAIAAEDPVELMISSKEMEVNWGLHQLVTHP